MNENYRLVKAYQENESMRKSFNNLAKAIFKLDFEDWYQNGYWKSNYIPYSIVDQDEIVANVSVNPMEFVHHGKTKQYIQLGTVMVNKAYRNQGLIRNLIQQVEEDYNGKVQGYFLFANDRVLDFYPRFGYTKTREYQYFKMVHYNIQNTAIKVSMKNKENGKQLEEAINMSSPQSDLWIKKNTQLVMFYVTKFMTENVYFVKNQNAYVIAELDKETLFVQDVFAPRKVDIEDILRAFGKDIKKVVLGFTPLNRESFQVKEINEQDTTLFIKGESLNTIQEDCLRIPTLGHA